MTLGERLRALRRTSRAQVAQEAGISVSHLERLERGKSDCTTAKAKALAKALGVPVEALLNPCPVGPIPLEAVADPQDREPEPSGVFLVCTRGAGHLNLHRDHRYGVSW